MDDEAHREVNDEAGEDQPVIKVEVISTDGGLMSRKPVDLPDFASRADDLGKALNGVAQGLRGQLSELAEHTIDAWDLDQVTLSFSLDLQVGTGVVIARASATAGFQATMTWKRASGPAK